MGGSHVLATARYIEMNSVAAHLVEHPEDYRWSSARAHLDGKDDGLVKVGPLLEMVGNWRSLLSPSSDEELDLLHRHEQTGRPLGVNDFVESLEQILGRALRPKEPGPKQERE